LEGDAAAVVELEAPLDGVPEVGEVVLVDGHGEGDGEADGVAAFHGFLLHGAEVGAAEFFLAGFLGAVELEIELQVATAGAFAKFFQEFVVFDDEDPVGVDEGVVDAFAFVKPVEEFEEVGVESGLAARELEEFDVVLALEDAVDSFLEFVEGMVFEAGVGADGGVGETGGAGEVAGVDDLDEGKAGGELFNGSVFFGEGIFAEGAGEAGWVGGAGTGVAAAVVVAAFGEPVEAGIGGDADGGAAVLGAGAAEEDAGGGLVGLPNAGGAGDVAEGAA
jgi:hypothetical protein